MIQLWNTVVYQPLYNALIFLAGILPLHDIGLAIIVLTVLVKLALFPLTKKQTEAQEEMKRIEPELKILKEKHKDNKQAQAAATMELYKKHKVNPAAGCLPALLQIPIIIGLYSVFVRGIIIDPVHIYGFITAPETLNLHFLGIVDLATKNLPIALLAGLTQFYQAHLMAKKRGVQAPAQTPQEEFANAMQIQMQYVFPVLIVFISYKFNAAVALYWTVSNIVGIIQDMIVRRRLHNKEINRKSTMRNS